MKNYRAEISPANPIRAAIVIIAALSVLFIDYSITIAQTPLFDAERAYSLIKQQCDFGPRNPESQGWLRCKEWLIESLESVGGEVVEQRFTGYDPHSGKTRQLSNIIARFGPHQGSTLMLCAHWDTRPVADREKEPAKASKPIMGANDGASGVAVLLEIARIISLDPPGRPIIIALFDGEDMGRESHPQEYALGSRYWALHPIPEMPSEAILLDMIGDADLEIPLEFYSKMYAPQLQAALWDIAGEIGSTAFQNTPGPAIEDDHVPLIRAGIPAVDLIDFDYPYWHTLEDTPDKCSAVSLGQVGRVLIEYIYR